MQVTYTLTLKGKPCIIISFLYFIPAVLVANYYLTREVNNVMINQQVQAYYT